MPYFEPQNVKILGSTYTVDTLPTPGANLLGFYARVSDLFGEKTDLVLCSLANGTYFWQPVRPIYAATRPVDQNLMLTSLKMPSVLFLTGGLLAGVTRTFTLDPLYAYPGSSFELAFDGTLGLGSVLNISGLIGGSTVSMLLGGRKRFFYDGNVAAWKTFQ